MYSYQVQALLLRAKEDTNGIDFFIDSDSELGPGEFSLKVEDEDNPLDQDITEIWVNEHTVLETISVCVAICTSFESKWLDFLSNVPLIGFLILRTRERFIYRRYQAEFG